MDSQDTKLGLPPLCGPNNEGQHIYVGDFAGKDTAEGAVSLHAETSSTEAKFSLRVEQIDCNRG